LFAFIDESSFPEPDDPSEHSVLLVCCINIEDIRSITRRVYQLKLEIFGGNNNVEIKAKNFIIRRNLKPDRTIKKKFVDKLFDIIESEKMKVYAMVMERPDYVPYNHPDKLPTYYTYLLQRINACGHYMKRNVSVIYDGQDPGRDEDISKRFYNLVYGVQHYQEIVEMPLFVSSKIVPGIQIADIMAGVVRHYHNLKLHKNKPSDDFEVWINNMYNIINSKTYRHKINGLKTHGIHIIGKNSLPKEA
jgi:hypothetical protein